MLVDARQMVAAWLTQIDPATPGMALDRHGQCLLIAANSESCMVFVPRSDSECFFLFTDVYSLPSHGTPEFYEALLSLNLLGLETGGGMLGLDTETRTIVFSTSRDIADTDAQRFCVLLQNFLAAATAIRSTLAEHLLSNEAQRSPSRPGATATRLRSFRT